MKEEEEEGEAVLGLMLVPVSAAWMYLQHHRLFQTLFPQTQVEIQMPATDARPRSSNYLNLIQNTTPES